MVIDMKELARQNVDIPELGTTITAIHETQYNDGNRCILATCLYANGDQEQIKISCNIPFEACNLIQPGEFFLKNWFEGKVIADALVKAGLVLLSGSDVQTGFVRAPIATIKVDDHDEDSDDEDFN